MQKEKEAQEEKYATKVLWLMIVKALQAKKGAAQQVDTSRVHAYFWKKRKKQEENCLSKIVSERCVIDQSVIWHKISGDWFFAQKAITMSLRKWLRKI